VTSGYNCTLMHWYNDADGRKVATADIGSYEDIPYGTVHHGTKHATGRPAHPQFGQWQQGISCSKASRTIMIDVDHPEQWNDSATYVALGSLSEVATSVREDGQRAHIWVVVPEELLHMWPAQGQAAFGGDIKSNGFSYHTGVHKSGMQYVATGNPIVIADEGLLQALAADRFVGEDGSPTGAQAGPWADDNYEITGDSQLTADIMSMVNAGMDDGEIHERLAVILKPLAEPWTAAQIESKIRSAQRKIDARIQAEDDVWNARHPAGAAGILADWQARQEQAKEEHREQRQAVYALPEPERPPLSLTYGNDQWLAQQMINLAGTLGYAYAADTGRFFQRIGDHWDSCPDDPSATIVALAADLVPKPTPEDESIMNGAGKLDELSLDGKLYKSLHMAATSQKIVTKMRALWPSVRPRMMEMDMDAEVRVFWAGGTPYDLRTLEPAALDLNSPHLLTAAYIPASGPTPLWDAFNKAQFPDPELREYALNVLASVLRGGNKLLPNFKSDGNMGKTTRLMLLVDLLGSYAEQLPIQLLTGRAGHDESFLRLKGKRLVWMDETPPAGKVAGEKLKSLSGGGQLTGRAMFGRKSVTFAMQHTLILAGNEDLPLTDENVYAIRVRYLPINGDKEEIARVSKQIWDGGGALSAAWKREAPSVLWEMMQRASNVIADPSLTNMPLAAMERLADAVLDQDHISRFVRDACELKGRTAAAFLYEAFVAWCQRNNIGHGEIPSITKFGRRLTKMGYESDKSSPTRDRPLSLRAHAMHF